MRHGLKSLAVSTESGWVYFGEELWPSLTSGSPLYVTTPYHCVREVPLNFH